MVEDCIIEPIDHSREITVIKLQILNLLHDVFLLLPDVFLLLQDLVELLADLFDTLLVGTAVMIFDVVDDKSVVDSLVINRLVVDIVDGSVVDSSVVGVGDSGRKRNHSIRNRNH